MKSIFWKVNKILTCVYYGKNANLSRIFWTYIMSFSILIPLHASRTKWWMWNCRGFGLKQLAMSRKKFVALELRPSSHQELQTSPIWFAETWSTSPSFDTGISQLSPANISCADSGMFQGEYRGEGVGETWDQCFQSEAKSWNLKAEIFWGMIKN